MGFMAGKRGLVTGVLHETSIATAISQSLLREGAECIFTHMPGEKMERRTRKLVEGMGVATPWLQPMDVGSDADLRDHDEVKPFPGLLHDVDDIAIAPGRVESVDAHRDGLRAEIDGLQRLDDIGARLRLVAGSNTVFQVQADHVRIGCRSLLEQGWTDARSKKL